jgi:REP element-mobilizing transposase RayT
MTALKLNNFRNGYDQITYHIVLVPNIEKTYSTIVELKMIAIYIILFMKQIYKIHALEMLEDMLTYLLEFNPRKLLSTVVQYSKECSSYRLFKLHP